MKTVLVTGGSKGIGLESVLRYTELGYRVVTCSRNESVWINVIEKFPQLKSVDYQVVDISNDTSLEEFFLYIKSQYKYLDIAINNASPALESRGDFCQVDTALLEATFREDFWAHAHCIKHELNLMKEGSTIINISSINGLRPTPNAAMYSAAKHALEGLTRSVALESIKSGIRVNAVAPGVTWTPRWEEQQVESPNIREYVSDAVPIKRFAKVNEIVDAIEFLSSDKASYIVGHTLVVDGGISLA
ncbi:SDR family NAD(P)-dependent oxidoreductase [Marinomonas posidonica]|uniref:3-oxoacyl-(Acyl-carrier-protein) reductase n=1 Tax=Marinomonas posidonica (strain CECT 7376 / NCIMB 14433 / IVIA-Po-181) TaxID=491952 RepID=F6CWN8_MARPP|nr:SDR family oxidoreductase [Marinomonas posidonica]AEF54388.1 3-oxoacyl-(acyl-carrier-protein) reductase [Marinomonas posidonica IVIA-Po-181]